MFYQGTLQDGINTALQQRKVVVCFVTDEGEESQRWEDEFLTDSAVKGLLGNQAVTLRLREGTEEAGYLEALFPVPRKPTVVVIQAAQLREYIASGTSKEEFIRRLGVALGVPAPAPASAPAPAPAANENVVSATPSTAPPPTESEDQRTAAVRAMMAERAQRLEADKKAKEAKAKAEREARRQNVSADESSYMSMLRRRKQDDKEERQRILKRIEDDKAERKEREAQERQARLLLSADQDPAEADKGKGVAIPLPNRGGSSRCNLQVRLLNGSTIRRHFSSDDTLGDQVRKWIDENRSDGDGPYSFRIVLSPLPNKTIEPSEESETLRDLGLAPSATLVLIPMVRVATAFERSGGFLWRGWSFIYAWLMMLFGPLGRLFHRPAPVERGPESEEIPLENLDGRGYARPRVRGFQNPDDRRRDYQLYNGNSLNFEPRPDDEDETDN